MDFKYKLIGGILLSSNSETDLVYPSFLVPIFQKDKQLYTQLAVRAKHPYTYLEDVFYEKFNMSEFKGKNPKTVSSFVPLENIDKSIDLSKKVYMFALSKYSVFYGNLFDFTDQLNTLKVNSKTVSNAKEIYNKRSKEFLKNGFTCHNEEMEKYLETQTFNI